MVYSFNPDLTLRWSSSVPRIGSSGPVLAHNGILIISGYQNDMRAYYTGEPLDANEENDNPITPVGYALYPAYPNPSDGSATISFALPESCEVELTLYDIKGRKVATIATGSYQPGEFSADVSGLSSGVYIYELRADEYSSTKKMVVK